MCTILALFKTSSDIFKKFFRRFHVCRFFVFFSRKLQFQMFSNYQEGTIIQKLKSNIMFYIFFYRIFICYLYWGNDKYLNTFYLLLVFREFMAAMVRRMINLFSVYRNFLHENFPKKSLGTIYP